MEKIVCYGILHYINVTVTINCVVSIIETNKECNNYMIIIVDNGSNNGTCEILREKFSAKKILIIKNDENLGYAKGINTAYTFAKNNYNLYCFIAMNSDMLVDRSFSATSIISNILDCEEHVILPDIIDSHGLHQNPFLKKPLSVIQYIISIIKNIIIILLISIPLLGRRIYRWYIERENKTSNNIINFNRYNFVPHGACIIFTFKWIKEESIALLPITFLYCEEEILYCYIQFKGYRMRFLPSLVIQHLEDASINSAYENGIRKRKFIYKVQTRSILAYLRFRIKLNLFRKC